MNIERKKINKKKLKGTRNNQRYTDKLKDEAEAKSAVTPIDPDEAFQQPGTANHKSSLAPTDIKKKKFRRNLIIGIIVGVLVVASVAFAFAYSILNTSFDDDELKAKEELTATSFNEPFYMLLVGTDTREEDSSYSLEDGRSDSCILVHIDPIKYIVTMISIPRDTKVTRNGSTEKFNAAYAEGGIAATIAETKKLCNVDIAHYAEISFNGLVDMVNAVGGVEVEVPETIDDPNAGHVDAGKHTLDGEEALAFARSRHFGDGDFTRSADQRILMDAMIKKAYAMSITELPNVLRAAKKFIKTDLRLGDMLGLATQFKDAEQLTIYSAMVPSYTSSENGISYVITDKDALRRMMLMVENGEDPLLVEITSGASAGSSRNAEELKTRQKEYYEKHPDSPGKASNSSSSNNSYKNTEVYEYDQDTYYY